MSATENPVAATAPTESKSARKKKAKAAEQAANPNPSLNGTTPNGHDIARTDTPDNAAPNADGSTEHPHLRELHKQIRNINKRLAGLAKTDSIIAENPGVALEELVKQRKINPDQKAAAEKKPGLQAQLAGLEEQVKVFKQVDADYQAQISKLKEELSSQHAKEVESLQERLTKEGGEKEGREFRRKLLVFSQFLRAAAARRNEGAGADEAENGAFEGALLLVYGGDEKAVETAVKIIEGVEEKVPSIEGTETSVSYARIRAASLEDTGFTESLDTSADDSATAPLTTDKVPQSDPTLTHATLTELDGAAASQTNGVHPVESFLPAQVSAGDEAGNTAGDAWDTGAGAASTDLGGEGFEMVPRPNEEVDVPAPAPAEQKAGGGGGSWADQATDAAAAHAVGSNKPVGQAEDASGWAGETSAATAPPDDGFQQIQARHPRGGDRGRSGRGNGEFRGRGGRGGRGRGEGQFRGTGERGGRGAFRGDRAPRGDGEFRGGRGRGRGGPRGGAGAGQAAV